MIANLNAMMSSACTILNERRAKLAIRYYKLFDYLNRHDMSKTEMAKAVGLSAPTLSKLSKGENVETNIIDRICRTLEVQPGDIMEYVPDSD